MIKVPLYDDRGGSPTRGELNEFFIGEQNLAVVKIPIGVYHEGWFSFHLAQCGVQEVLGVDIRPERIERARWIANVTGTTNARFEVRDLFSLEPAEIGTFDIVFCIGIFYHLENPMGLLRVAQRLTKTVCLLEGQVARPAMLSASWAGVFEREGPGCILLPGESVHVHEPSGIVLVPSLAALQQMAFRAGFRDIHLVLASEALHEQYQLQERVMAFAYQ